MPTTGFSWQKFFQAVLQTEENVLPIIFPNPTPVESRYIGAILVTETIFEQIFGLTPAAPVPAATSPAAAPVPSAQP